MMSSSYGSLLGPFVYILCMLLVIYYMFGSWVGVIPLPYPVILWSVRLATWAKHESDRK
jgi:hypothetical protein